jgi:NADH-ubiquinone oxidoreductase chain 2
MLLIGLILLLLATAISSSTQRKFIREVVNLSEFNKSTNSENKSGLGSDNNYNKERILYKSEIKFSSLIITRITFLLLLFSAFLSYNSNYIENITNGIGVYQGLFQVSSITQSFDCFLYLTASILLLILALNSFTSRHGSINNIITSNNTKIEPLDEKTSQIIKTNPLDELNWSQTGVTIEYSLIILFNIIGASLLISSGDLVSMYISIELQSFALYILATLYRDSEKAAGAGLKYFLLGGLSSCFILLGGGLLYVSTGLTNLESIFLLFNIEETTKSIEIGLVILFVGFLFKISAAPFHNWAPDVYDAVPTHVTLWLSVITKISISIFLLNLVYYILISYSDSNLEGLNLSLLLLLISSFLSLLIGTIVGLVQFRIKRLLAYSTISHIGFLLLALVVSNKESFESFMFYLIQYTITNANNFMILLAFGYLIFRMRGNVKDIYSPIEYIDDLKGQFKVNPILSLCFAISLFSLAGIPPLIGFFGKQMVLLSALSGGYIGLTLIAILVSVISAAYYLRIISSMIFDDYPIYKEDISSLNSLSSDELIKEKNLLDNYLPKNNNFHSIYENYLSNSLSFWISTLTLITILFIIKPYLLLNWTHLLALSLFFG